MANTRTGKKRPVRGKQSRQEYIYNTNRKKAELLREEELSLTGMIQEISDKVEAANDEMSITRMIETATVEAAEKSEGITGDIFGSAVLNQPQEKTEEPDSTIAGKKKLIKYLSAALAVLILIVSAAAVSGNNTEKAGSGTGSHGDDIAPEHSAEEPVRENHLLALQDEIEAYLYDADGEWSVYVKDLSTDDSIAINDVQMPSASLIKLFTAGRYLEAVENGELYETDSSAYWLQAMITWSDNDSWELLETMIGGGDYSTGLLSVTDFAQRFGCPYSGRLIGTENIYDYDAENLTTASEVGKVLEAIYNGTYVSLAASQRLYELMAAQAYVQKIPAGLPEGFVSASKSGELPGIENDAAIIKGPDTDYILVVMSNGFYYGVAAVEDIVEISAMCAYYLNPSVQ